MLKKIRNLFRRRPEAPEALPAGSAAPRATAEPLPAVHHGPRVVHRPIPRSDLDPDAVKIVERLTRFDHTAYFVGGCVRDLLADLKPKDFDIGTSATPRQVRRVFRNCRIIGKRFRLAHIYFQDGKIIEVATFRARDVEDDAPSDGSQDLLIKDDNLFGTPEEDALRRDFTINALFYDLANETVLDHADGLGDLRRRLVRTIGDPDVRFREDPIRALRAIRFAARLDFEIEPRTLEALRRHRGEIPKAAAPRILEEINRFCRGGGARRSFELLRDTGTFPVILEELDAPYRARPQAWEELFGLLAAIDERSAGGRTTSLGAILTALLLPIVRERLGWRDDGTVVHPGSAGLPVREMVDEILRPLALRLRVPRREQEHCRQALHSLYRMVPSRSARRQTRRTLLARECLPDTLWILEAVSRRFGGVFGEAFDAWSRAAESAGPPPREDSGGRRRGRSPGGRAEPAPRQEGERATTSDPKPARRRRRRSRGGGGGSADRAPSAERAVARPVRPERWDDDYFFSALPTVPDGLADQPLPPRDEAPAEGDEPELAGDGDAPAAARAPRRRRRRRRRAGAGANARSDEPGGDD